MGIGPDPTLAGHDTVHDCRATLGGPPSLCDKILCDKCRCLQAVLYGVFDATQGCHVFPKPHYFAHYISSDLGCQAVPCSSKSYIHAQDKILHEKGSRHCPVLCCRQSKRSVLATVRPFISHLGSLTSSSVHRVEGNPYMYKGVDSSAADLAFLWFCLSPAESTWSTALPLFPSVCCCNSYHQLRLLASYSMYAHSQSGFSESRILSGYGSMAPGPSFLRRGGLMGEELIVARSDTHGDHLPHVSVTDTFRRQLGLPDDPVNINHSFRTVELYRAWTAPSEQQPWGSEPLFPVSGQDDHPSLLLASRFQALISTGVTPCWTKPLDAGQSWLIVQDGESFCWRGIVPAPRTAPRESGPTWQPKGTRSQQAAAALGSRIPVDYAPTEKEGSLSELQLLLWHDLRDHPRYHQAMRTPMTNEDEGESDAIASALQEVYDRVSNLELHSRRQLDRFLSSASAKPSGASDSGPSELAIPERSRSSPAKKRRKSPRDGPAEFKKLAFIEDFARRRSIEGDGTRNVADAVLQATQSNATLRDSLQADYLIDRYNRELEDVAGRHPVSRRYMQLRVPSTNTELTSNGDRVERRWPRTIQYYPTDLKHPSTDNFQPIW